MAETGPYVKHRVSKQLFAAAQRYISGGVNSPVRAFNAVGGTPLFITQGRGSRIYDADGNDYIDYVMSWGALILGHAAPPVIQAVRKALCHGTSFGAPTAAETVLAQRICQAFPSIERVRFVNSGTEAVMTAVRIARAYTRRNTIIKFAGCYHGHSDSLLVKAGSGAATLGIPDSAGVPRRAALDTMVLDYNNSAQFEKIMARQGEKIAAVVVEPIAANMGLVLPHPGFLQTLRALTRKFSAVLIFDEVISGFRVLYGGAQSRYALAPDLTCLGKIIGGGFPVGAVGGKKELMELLAPLGPVYQAGTLSGNPVAMTAGITTLDMLATGNRYAVLEEKTRVLAEALQQNAAQAGVPIVCARIASLMTLFFTKHAVVDYQTAKLSDVDSYRVYFKTMLAQGIYIAPSPFETLFVSARHTGADLSHTIAASRIAFKSVRRFMGPRSGCRSRSLAAAG